MLYGEVGPGQIVLVDIEGEGPTATFTFKGQKIGVLPDLPPFETADVAADPVLGNDPVRGEGDDATPGPTDIEKSTGTD
jgi:ATP-dependent Clp protease ATP-binding subunit ClpC